MPLESSSFYGDFLGPQQLQLSEHCLRTQNKNREKEGGNGLRQSHENWCKGLPLAHLANTESNANIYETLLTEYLRNSDAEDQL